MRTPKKYHTLLNNKTLTENLIGQVLFSINKRAKNYQDKRNHYRHSCYKHAYASMMCYQEKLDEAYTITRNILAFVPKIPLFCS